MADNPNQIDISLSLLGGDSPAVLSALVQQLQNVAKTMDRVQAVLPEGQWNPVQLQDASGSAGSRPIAATSPSDAPSLPSRAPDSSFIDLYSQSPSIVEPDYTPSPGAPGKYDESWARRKLTAYQADNPASDQSIVSKLGSTVWSGATNAAQVLTQPIRSAAFQTGGVLDAFKEDPAALTTAMASSMWDSSKQLVGNVWNGMRGTDKGQPLSRFEQGRNLAINLAGAPWVMQNMLKVLPTTLPMLADPGALAQMGGETGRGTIGPSIGPFSIPYFSAGGAYGAQQTIQSFWEGLTTAGLSGKQALNIRENLGQLGWGGQDSQGDLDRMTRVVENIVKGNKAFDIPTTTAMLDKSMRWGGYSLQDFQKTLQAMPRAAQEAKMSLTEFQKAVADTAGIATQAGADYMLGVRNTTNFTRMTGLPPQLYGQFLQNPWMQANMMGTTGALPWEQGLLGPDTVMQSGVNVANMLTKTFENARPNGLTYRDPSGRLRHISSFMTGTAGAANVLGMSPQELRKMERSRNLLPARARAWDDLNAYPKEVNKPGSWDRITRDVLAGKYHPEGEVKKRLQHIYETTKGHPQQRADQLKAALEKWTANNAGTSQDPNKVVISLAGDASRYFRLNADKQKHKRSVNAGGAASNNQLGTMGLPSPSTFDPYAIPNPGDTQATNAFSAPTGG